MRRLATWVAALGLAAYVALIGIEIATARADGPYDVGPVILGLGLVGSVAIGFVILRRTGNAIGWIFLGFGTCGLLWAMTGEYLVYATGVSPLPASTAFALTGNVLASGMVFAVALLCLVFPTGHIPSARWRWVLWVWWIGIILTVTWNAIRPGTVWGAEGRVTATIASPFDVPTWLTEPMITVGAVMRFAVAFAGIVSLVVRARRATGEERLQIRWLSWVAGTVAMLILAMLALALADVRLDAGWFQVANNVLFACTAILIVIGMPIAVAIAILKYKLYEIDVVISKTIVFAGLVLFITLVRGHRGGYRRA